MEMVVNNYIDFFLKEKRGEGELYMAKIIQTTLVAYIIISRNQICQYVIFAL